MNNYDFSKKEDYERLTKNISRVLRRFGIPDDPSDFAQEYVCGVLEGKHRHQAIEQFVIDVLRKRSGRKGSISYDQKLAITYAGSIDNPGLQVSDRGGSQDDMDSRIHRDRNREYVKSGEFELYSEGFTMKDIGRMYGVSQSRVSQRLNKVKSIFEKLEVINALQISPETKRWAKRFL